MAPFCYGPRLDVSWRRSLLPTVTFRCEETHLRPHPVPKCKLNMNPDAKICKMFMVEIPQSILSSSPSSALELMQLLMPIPSAIASEISHAHSSHPSLTGNSSPWNPSPLFWQAPPSIKKSQLRKLLQKVVAITDTGVRNNFSNQRRFVYV